MSRRSQVSGGSVPSWHLFLHKCNEPPMADKPKQSPKRDARLNLTIQEDIYIEFKVQAARERLSMSELVERMIAEYLNGKKA